MEGPFSASPGKGRARAFVVRSLARIVWRAVSRLLDLESVSSQKVYFLP